MKVVAEGVSFFFGGVGVGGLNSMELVCFSTCFFIFELVRWHFFPEWIGFFNHVSFVHGVAVPFFLIHSL